MRGRRPCRAQTAWSRASCRARCPRPSGAGSDGRRHPGCGHRTRRVALASTGVRSSRLALRLPGTSIWRKHSGWPTISSTVRKPRLAMTSRSCSATKSIKCSTCSGLAAEAATQAAVLRGDAGGAGILLAVALHEAAHRDCAAWSQSQTPRRPAQATATPVPSMSLPSASSTTRERRPFCSSVCWASARPSSSGRPACQIESRAAAPEPPLWPLIKILSAAPLATPVAMVPTPASLTSLTDTRAPGLAFLRSKMSSARSSME